MDLFTVFFLITAVLSGIYLKDKLSALLAHHFKCLDSQVEYHKQSAELLAEVVEQQRAKNKKLKQRELDSLKRREFERGKKTSNVTPLNPYADMKSGEKMATYDRSQNF